MADLHLSERAASMQMIKLATLISAISFAVLFSQPETGLARGFDCQGGPSRLPFNLPEAKIRFLRIWSKNHRPVPAPDLFMPDSTEISDLLDKDGNVWLFRVISDEYQKGFDKSRFIKRQDGGYSESGYSYSLSPHIGIDWNPSGKLILISRQNLHSDQLTFPRNSLEDTQPLTERTEIGNMLDFYEVKVPVMKENVVALVEQERFNDIANSFGEKQFAMRSFLETVLCDPATRTPSDPPPPSIPDPIGSCSFVTDKSNCIPNVRKSVCDNLNEQMKKAPNGKYAAHFKALGTCRGEL
jgi:hypothetical protein